MSFTDFFSKLLDGETTNLQKLADDCNIDHNVAVVTKNAKLAEKVDGVYKVDSEVVDEFLEDPEVLEQTIREVANEYGNALNKKMGGSSDSGVFGGFFSGW